MPSNTNMKTYSYWKKLSLSEINSRVSEAIDGNINFYSDPVLGLPVSHLDDPVFFRNTPKDAFLKNVPILNAYINNPNHIGCHTLGSSEPFFEGTQALEKEVVGICAEDILGGKADETDGYFCGGGTEGNIQALWILRNYYINLFAAEYGQICILCSEDSHYSINKAANLLNITLYKVKVDEDTRGMTTDVLNKKIGEAKKAGAKYFIVVANMMSTMFGSVDDIDILTDCLVENGVVFKIHVDGAYGGFFYPFSNIHNLLGFSNQHVATAVMDAHKLLRAPYGTGIFLSRKGLLQNTATKEAGYVVGGDFTLAGSRSGANAVAVWMILMTYGPQGWKKNIEGLLQKSERFRQSLSGCTISYFNHEHSNKFAFRAKHITPEIAKAFRLIPNSQENPNWYKCVIMNHVTDYDLNSLSESLHKLF